MTTDIFTLREAAEYLKVSERTLWELAKAGDVPNFKVGHQYRFNRRLLDQWAADQSDAQNGVS